MSGSSSLMWGDVGGSYLTMALFLPNDPAEHGPLLPNDPLPTTIKHGEACGREPGDLGSRPRMPLGEDPGVPRDPTIMRPLLGKSESNISPELFRL